MKKLWATAAVAASVAGLATTAAPAMAAGDDTGTTSASGTGGPAGFGAAYVDPTCAALIRVMQTTTARIALRRPLVRAMLITAVLWPQGSNNGTSGHDFA